MLKRAKEMCMVVLKRYDVAAKEMDGSAREKDVAFEKKMVLEERVLLGYREEEMAANARHKMRSC
jgi:hypothetical protein